VKRNAKNNLPCVCNYCHKVFYAARITAKFCPGGKCKTAYHREKQKNGGNTWNDVDPKYFDKYHLIKSISDEAALCIYDVLVTDGARHCEKSIEVAYIALVQCLQADMFKRDETCARFQIPQRMAV